VLGSLASAPLPPVRLASEEELRAAAASALLVDRIGRFVAWLGEGRRLTQAGNLAVADGKELLGVLGVADVADARVQERLPDSGTRDLLVALYQADEPVPLGDLAASAWEDVERVFDLGEDPRQLEFPNLLRAVRKSFR
jgi:hypothetical protein